MKKSTKNQYIPNEIEPKWQSKWEIEKIYHPNLESAKKPFYNLMMFPYPSAEGMHAGNFFTFTGVDIYGRFKRMQGYDVFEPIGLDGFGIHSENYALKVGSHPVEQSQKSEENFYRQFRSSGNSYDWDRTVETYKPDYYKWTQWLFTELFKEGLAYRKKSPVNFCPGCMTVLADEQVIDGKCERCESIVEKKNLEQWFFRITQYADRLLSNINSLNWTEKVKIAQRNWIGRSEGARIEFKVQSSNSKVEVFTTAIDTIYGVTFMVVSPEHPLVLEILEKAADDKQAQKIRDYIEYAKNKPEMERTAEGKEKTGVFSGAYVVNPFNNEQIPLWIADYVLMGYGTGAVMGVPGHDARDHEFAEKFELPIKSVVKPVGDAEGTKVGKDGFWDYLEIKTKFAKKSVLFDSGVFDGLNSFEAKAKMLDFIKQQGFGEKTTTYHLRDWLISRQRYWGPPIPMVYCASCAKKGLSWFDTEEAKKSNKGMGNSNLKSQISNKKEIENLKLKIENSAAEAAGWYPVPEKDLPVELPYIEDFKPLGIHSAGSGQAGVNSPLAMHPEFYNTKCPHCGKEAKRETDVSDTFLDSAWYFLRYLATDRDDIPFPMLNPKSEARNTKQSQNTNDKNSKSFRVSNFDIRDSSQRLAWLPVTMYIGGAEHSVLHLLYSRFITMFLKDRGMIGFEEPFARFYAHGLIIKDGAKMSKSKGNIINPDEYIRKYGSDTLRSYLHFLGPFDQTGDFRDSGVEGMNRFIKRVWTMYTSKKIVSTPPSSSANSVMHEAIKKVTGELEDLRFNTALAHMMSYYNYLSKQAEISREEAEVYLKLLAPFAPHMTEELYQLLRNSQNHAEPELKTTQKNSVVPREVPRSSALDSIHTSSWPDFDEKYLIADTIKIPVQVNGKLRGMIEVASGEVKDKAKIEEMARKDGKISVFLEGQKIKKVIYIEGKVMNFVVDTGKS